MDTSHLYCFRTTAYMEHMTRAAEALHMAQPALSKIISGLETELGVRLFDRQGKFIRLNAQGKIYLARVERALTELEDGRTEIQDMAGIRDGEVRLAVFAASSLLPGLLSGFRKHYPGISFHLLQHTAGRQVFSHADLCIAAAPPGVAGCSIRPLFTEEIFLAVPREHALAGRRHIRLEEVRHESFISLSHGQSLRDTTDAFCQQAGFVPDVAFESDDPATVRGLIQAGQGIAFMPAVSWGGTAGDTVTLLKIDSPKCMRTVSLYWDETRYLPEAVRVFSAHASAYFRTLTDVAGR